METFVIRARDSRNMLIKERINARTASQARELFENMYPNLRIESVLLERYSY